MATRKTAAPVAPEPQPPQDNDHVAPGAEQFPEPVLLSEHRPSYPEALAMFKENPGLAWIQTEDGNLSRDGVLVPQAQGE